MSIQDIKKQSLSSIQDMLTEMYDEKVDQPTKEFTLRASGLPVCQQKVMWHKLHKDTDEPLPYTNTSFSFEYFTSVGTTIHTVTQRWLGKVGYLFGNYQCRSCGFKTEKPVLGWPKTCTANCYGNNWDYVEFSLVDVIPTSGLQSVHCDGLLHFPWQKPNHFILFDIKTTSISSAPTTGKDFTSDQHKKYLYQSGVYVHLFETKGYHIDGTAFIMIPRDNPRKSTIVFYDQTETASDIFKKSIEAHDVAVAATDEGNLTRIRKSCESVKDQPDCPFNELCFNDRLGRKTLERLFLKKNGKLPILN